jgi:HlyD family secretion protein
VKIDPEKYRSERDRLAANVRVSSTAIESETANLKNYELEARRANQLYTQGILAISEKERADLAVETSRIRIRSLKEEVSQARPALSRAQSDLGKATIYAPMAGKVTQVNTEVGEQVIVGTTNIPGSVIMVISDMSEVLAEVSVDETEIVRLAPGQAAQVNVDAVEKTTYAGA